MMHEEYRVFWKYVLGILAKRDYCEHQIRKKLQQREAPVDCIEHILQRLLALNYLDEQRFTQSFFRMQLRRGLALRMIGYKARQQGVKQQYIDVVLSELQSKQDSPAICRQLILKRDPQRLYRDNKKHQLRLMHFLQRRGFDTDSILRAFDTLPTEQEQET